MARTWPCIPEASASRDTPKAQGCLIRGTWSSKLAQIRCSMLGTVGSPAARLRATPEGRLNEHEALALAFSLSLSLSLPLTLHRPLLVALSLSPSLSLFRSLSLSLSLCLFLFVYNIIYIYLHPGQQVSVGWKFPSNLAVMLCKWQKHM